MRLHLSTVVYLAVAACAIAVVLLSHYVEPLSPKDLALAVVPVLSTFLGATLAFRLNEKAAEDKEMERRYLALNEALFVLVRQHNAVHQIKSEFDKYNNEYARAFVLPAVKPPSYVDLRQKLDSLTFLLLESEPQILFELSVEQERFEQIQEALRLRNQHYVEQVQPAMTAAGLNDRTVQALEIELKLAVPVYRGAIQAASNVYEQLQKSSKSIFAMHAQLIALSRNLFPGRKFVSYE